MSLGENIRMRREALKLSQEYVADQLGVSRQAVSKWETGKSEPTAANLVGLTELFEIGLSELVEGKKDTPEPSPKKEPNLILRANLIKLAIIMQMCFLVASVVAIDDYRILSAKVKSGVLIVPVPMFLALLAASSVWMASNHRFEPDIKWRRKNAYIETAYCAIQAVLGLLDLHWRAAHMYCCDHLRTVYKPKIHGPETDKVASRSPALSTPSSKNALGSGRHPAKNNQKKKEVKHDFRRT